MAMTHYRWKIIALAFIAVIITYLDRAALSYTITPLQVEFRFTNTDFGLIAAAFGIGYMVMTVIGGVLVDTYGARKIWSLFSFLWSLACALLAFASGFISFFLFRLLLGVCEGPSFPALTRVSADWLPVAERVRSLAIGLAAVPFASVIGAPLLAHLVFFVGWRWMFIILGSFGIIWAIIWHNIFRDQPRDCHRVASEELTYIEQGLKIHREVKARNQHTTDLRFLLVNPALLVNNYAFFVFGYLLFFAITWLPAYLEQSYQVQVRETGWFLIAPWTMATCLLLLGGVISDKIWQKTKRIRLSRSWVIAVCQVLSACCFIPTVLYHSLPIALLSISLGIGFGMMPNAAFYAINADLAHDRAATSLGIMDCGFALAGILAPLLTGG